jgi:hypothetical protein
VSDFWSTFDRRAFLSGLGSVVALTVGFPIPSEAFATSDQKLTHQAGDENVLQQFQRRFPEDPWRRADAAAAEVVSDPDLRVFFDRFGGRSFGGGIYRTIHPADAAIWQERIRAAFPELHARATCFGFDWLGRVFALDSGRSEEDRPAVLMLEPGSGEAFNIPANLRSFHEVALLVHTDAVLADSFYESWRAQGGAAPAYDQCVGYRVPLFFGAPDDTSNLTMIDINVYWHIMGQLIPQTRDLPAGTRVHITVDGQEP